MCIVVLNQTLGPDIPDLDGLISRAPSDTSAIRMESNLIYAALVIVEATNVIFGRHIPQFDETIFTSGCNEPGIWAELSRFDPVCVGCDTEKEFAILQLETLK